MKSKTVFAFCDKKNKTVSVLKEILYESGRKGKLGKRIRCLSDDEECGVLGCRYSKYKKTGIGEVGKDPSKLGK